jgi:uncharacterized protein with LGFP repeats
MRLKSSAVAAAIVAAALLAPAAQASPIQDPPAHDSSAVEQDLRHLEAGGTTDRATGVAADAQPITSVKAEPATDDGLPWDALTLGLAVTALALTVTAIVASRRRRSRRTRVAA